MSSAALEAARIACNKYMAKYAGRQKIIVSRRWGFTKLARTDYIMWKEEARIVNDGVNAKLFGYHGPLARRHAGQAFLEAAEVSAYNEVQAFVVRRQYLCTIAATKRLNSYRQ